MMGVSIENRVVLICKDDESDWKPSGIDGKPVGSYGYQCLANEDWRVVSEWDEQECISEFSHKENGTFIQLDSCGEGVIAIDRLALPKSTQAIVRLVSHLQGEDIHFIERVTASNIATHDWSLAGKEDQQLPYAPPPPDNWKGDTDEWWDSEVLRIYQQKFDENLENAFNTLVLDVLTAREAGIDISSAPQGKDVVVFDDGTATHTQAQINEYKKELVAYYEASDSWYRVIGSCYVAFAFQGQLTEDLQIELREMSDDFDNDDEGISFSDTSEGRSKAFHTAIRQLADELTPEKLWELQEHFELFTSAELVPMVQKKPEYQPYFYKWLVRYPDQLDELLVYDANVYGMFRKELVAGRQAVMDYFGEDGAIEVDYRDTELCSLLKEDGWTIKTSDGLEAREAQSEMWARENDAIRRGATQPPSGYTKFLIETGYQDENDKPITQSVIYKSLEELEENIGTTTVLSSEEVKIDPSNTVRGLFYWNDGCLSDLEIRSFASVEDVDVFMKTIDGGLYGGEVAGTGHFHFAYYDIFKGGRITQTVIGEPLPAEESPSAIAGKKKVKEEKEKEVDTRTDHDIFMDALNDSFLDDIFLEAERFKAEIHSNIQDIAELYCEDNEVCLTGKEPAWLIELFDKYSVYYIKG